MKLFLHNTKGNYEEWDHGPFPEPAFHHHPEATHPNSIRIRTFSDMGSREREPREHQEHLPSDGMDRANRWMGENWREKSIRPAKRGGEQEEDSHTHTLRRSTLENSPRAAAADTVAPATPTAQEWTRRRRTCERRGKDIIQGSEKLFFKVSTIYGSILFEVDHWAEGECKNRLTASRNGGAVEQETVDNSRRRPS